MIKYKYTTKEGVVTEYIYANVLQAPIKRDGQGRGKFAIIRVPKKYIGTKVRIDFLAD